MGTRVYMHGRRSMDIGVYDRLSMGTRGVFGRCSMEIGVYDRCSMDIGVYVRCSMDNRVCDKRRTFMKMEKQT